MEVAGEVEDQEDRQREAKASTEERYPVPDVAKEEEEAEAAAEEDGAAM